MQTGYVRAGLVGWIAIAASGCSKPAADVAGPSTADAATSSGLGDGGGAGCTTPTVAAGVSLGSAYQASYTAYLLGELPGLPDEKYGGLTLKSGDPNTLLLGCYDNSTDVGALCAVALARSCGHVVGFEGSVAQVASAPDVDGSIDYAANGVLLFTGWPSNTMGELAPGGTAPARTLDLTSLGVTSSVGTLAIVPAGFAGAGAVKVISYDTGHYYSAALAADAMGLYTLTGVAQGATLQGGPEGQAYVPLGSPQFAANSMILDEWDNNTVVTYSVDGSGDPIVASRAVFLEGITGPEGAFFDPSTGDFFFSTWNESGGVDRLYVVQGFATIE